MRIGRACVAASLLAGISHTARAEPNVQVLSPSASLSDGTTGDSYVRFSTGDPAKLTLTGPGRFQGDFRVNLATDKPPSPADSAIVTILSSGKAVGSFRIQPKVSEATWKGEAALRPSLSAGFYLDVEAGPQPYEFRVTGAPAGAALHIVAASGARKALAANSLVFPARAPATTMAAAAPAEAAPLDAAPPMVGKGLSLKKVNGLGAGLVMVESEATPFVEYRIWLANRFGVHAKGSLSTRSRETLVESSPSGAPASGSRLAPGFGYDADLLVGAFLNVRRSPGTALYVLSSAGPAFQKDLRREAEMGVRGDVGFGVELAPPAFPYLGFTLEGTFRVSSFPSERLGTSVDPAVAATFHYYLR